MFEIEYHKLEHLGTLERSHICLKTLEEAMEMAETIRQETGIIVEITEKSLPVWAANKDGGKDRSK